MSFLAQLVDACKDGRLADVKTLVGSEPSLLQNLKDESGRTPLHYASEYGHRPVVEYLLEEECSPIAETSDKTTPVHLACSNNRVDVVLLLLGKLGHAQAQILMRKGSNLLHLACEIGSVKIVQAILELVQDQYSQVVGYKDEKGLTPLHHACYRGHMSVVELLVEKGCDPSVETSDRSTCMHLACDNQNEEVALYLLQKVSSLHLLRKTNKDGNNALHLASKAGSILLVKAILEFFKEQATELVGSTNKKGYTPLHQASQYGHLQVVQYLLEQPGSNPSCKASDRSIPLHLACEYNHFEVALCLLEALPDSYSRSRKDGNTPLHLAAKAGNFQLAQEILKQAQGQASACCVSTNQNGNTPLGMIAWSQAAKNHDNSSPHYKLANLLLGQVIGNPAKELKDFSTLHPSLKITRSLSMPMKVYVIGDLHESKVLNQVLGYTLPVGASVDDDCQKLGMVPFDLTIQSIDSRVILYDLASSDTFIQENMLHTKQEVERSAFIICIDLEDKRDVKTKILYWLSFLHHQVVRCAPGVKPNVIFIAKPSDKPDTRRLSSAYSQLESIKKVPECFNILRRFNLDGRKRGFSGLSDLRVTLKKHFQSVQPNDVQGDAGSQLYILEAVMENEFPDVSFVLGDLQTKIAAGSPHNAFLALLPQSFEELLKLCQQLEDRECIIIKADVSGTAIENTLIIHRGKQILTEINTALCSRDSGTVSALMTPKKLQQHLQSIPLEFDVLVHVMNYYKVHELIEELPGGELFYIPALLPEKHNLIPWDDESFVVFAWALVPATQSDLDFFMPRFLKMLLLRLHTLATQRQFKDCSIWVDGIVFSSIDDTMDVCVSSNAQGIILNMRYKSECEIDCLLCRNEIMSLIQSSMKKYQPSVEACAVILLPTQTTHLPFQEIQGETIDISDPKVATHEKLAELPFFEPFSCLSKLPFECGHLFTDPRSTEESISEVNMSAIINAIGQTAWCDLKKHFPFTTTSVVETSKASGSSEDAELVHKNKGQAFMYGQLLKYLATVSIFGQSLRHALRKALRHDSSGAQPDVGLMEDGSECVLVSTGRKESTTELTTEDPPCGRPTTASSSNSGSGASHSSSEAPKPDQQSTACSHLVLENVLRGSPKQDVFQFIDRTKVFESDCKGGRFTYEEHDVHVKIPEGTLETKFSMEVGVTLHGNFTFPKNTKPLSAVVMLYYEDGYPLQKPIDLIIPHAFGYSDTQVLSFFQATKSKRTVEKLSFHKSKSEAHIWGDRGKIQITLKPGAHYFFIGCKITPDTIGKTNYCIIKVTPKSLCETYWQLQVYVSYSLRTCIEMVKRRYRDQNYEINCYNFQFKPDGDKDPRITLDFQSPIGEWHLTLEGQLDIEESEIDFSSEKVQSNIDCYPPSFTLNVTGERDSNKTAVVKCMGMKKPLQLAIPLRPLSGCSPAGYGENPLTSSFQGNSPRQHTLTGSFISEDCSIPDGLQARRYEYENTFPVLPKWSHRRMPSSTSTQSAYFHQYSAAPMCEEQRFLPSYSSLPALPPPSPVIDQKAAATGIEIQEVAKEILEQLEDDWKIMMDYLSLPGHVQVEVKAENGLRNKVAAMLHKWAAMNTANSRAELAKHLRRVDSRLRKIAYKLDTGQIPDPLQ